MKKYIRSSFDENKYNRLKGEALTYDTKLEIVPVNRCKGIPRYLYKCISRIRVPEADYSDLAGYFEVEGGEVIVPYLVPSLIVECNFEEFSKEEFIEELSDAGWDVTEI